MRQWRLAVPAATEDAAVAEAPADEAAAAVRARSHFSY